MLHRHSLILLLILLSIPSTFAISLSGPPLTTIIYQPGAKIIAHYTIEDTDKPVDIRVYGNLSDYLSINMTDKLSFDMTMNFPNRPYVKAGTYYFVLDISETSNSSQGIGQMLSIRKKFRVLVPEESPSTQPQPKYNNYLIVLAITIALLIAWNIFNPRRTKEDVNNEKK